MKEKLKSDMKTWIFLVRFRSACYWCEECVNVYRAKFGIEANFLFSFSLLLFAQPACINPPPMKIYASPLITPQNLCYIPTQFSAISRVSEKIGEENYEGKTSFPSYLRFFTIASLVSDETWQKALKLKEFPFVRFCSCSINLEINYGWWWGKD